MASEADKKIDYIEIPASDLPATKAFPSSLVGWNFTDFGPEYTALATAASMAGSISPTTKRRS